MNYIGSKLSILDFIDNTINEFTDLENKQITICDIFSGTASVGKYFKNKGYNVISNDIQYYSYVIAKHFIENNNELTFENLKKNGIDNPFEYLNKLNEEKGFIYKNYSWEGTQDKEFQRLYFTDENAKKIDSMRKQIEEWKSENLLSCEEYYYLLASLLEATDKVANTASVYEAFLKSIKKSASQKIVIKPLEVLTSDNNNIYKVYNMNANDLIKEISGDILYMDPPYNTRRYDTNYHILETIALNDNPAIKGKTGVRDENNKKSKYCIKREVEETFEDIVKNANFKYILLSYNDEGILPIEKIEYIMSNYGKYKRYEQVHKRYKADKNRKYLKNDTIEYIHCLKKKGI